MWRTLVTVPLLISCVFSKSPEGCGYRNPDGIGSRISATSAESNQAEFGEFPWMVMILEQGKFCCGGSLIHPSVVLTAAHCVKKDTDNYKVRAGEWNDTSTAEVLRHRERYVVKIKTHQNFGSQNFRNDIALLFLDKPFSMGRHINLVCLLPHDVQIVNKECFVTGWGQAMYGPRQLKSSVLRKIDVPIVDSNTCQENLRRTRLGEYFKLDKSFVCAGGEKGKDACKGDGGGPLVCPIDDQEDRFQQVGIVSWGLGCNDEVPGVYTSVGFLRGWIDDQMIQGSLSKSYYTY